MGEVVSGRYQGMRCHAFASNEKTRRQAVRIGLALTVILGAELEIPTWAPGMEELVHKAKSDSHLV